MRLFKMLVGSIVSMSAVAVAAGCTGGSGTGDGGTMDAGPLPDGAILPDGGCPTVMPVLDNVTATALQISGDDLVFLDEAAGPPFLTEHTRAIRKVKVDGTGDTTLYTAPMGFQINDLYVQGSTIYFLESERDTMTTNEITRVYSLPVAGGMRTLIQLHDDPSNGASGDRLDAIAAVDASALYLVRNILAPASVFRMPLAGGAETIVTKVPISTRPQLLGSDLYFRTATFVMGSGYYGIGKVPTSGSMAMPTQVGMAHFRGDLRVGTWGFAVSGALETMTEKKLSKFDTNGAGHVELFTEDDNLRIGATDNTSLFVVGESSTTNSTGENIYKVPIAGGAPTVVACGRRKIDPRGGGGNGAYSFGLEMVLSATHVYWIETRREGTADKTAIFRVPL